MFIIDLRNTRVSNYDFSVIGNNNVDVVHFYSHFTQYATGYKVYLKVRSIDDDYVDKIEIDSQDISIDDGSLLVKWTMGEVSTQCKKIEVQLQFENNDGSIIAQSRITSITLFDTIDVERLIPVIYPKILKRLQEEIDTLFAGSGAKIALGYANDVFTINLLNANNDVVDTKTITIPTRKAFIGVSFIDKIITFTANDGSTETIDLTGFYTSVQVDALLAEKVSKVHEANKLYGTDNVGLETTYDLSVMSSAGTIPLRDASGRLVTATPANPTDATNKYYVDNLVANIKKDSYKEVDTTEYPTLNDFLASTGEEGYLYLYPIDTTDLTKGYYRYIWESNTWLDLGTTQIDLSNYYTKTEANSLFVDFSSDQRITGFKRFATHIGIDGGASSTPHEIGYANPSAVSVKLEGITYYYFSKTYISAETNNTIDLGTSTRKFKNLYLAGDLYGNNYHFGIDYAYMSINNYVDGSGSTTLSYNVTRVENRTTDKTYTLQEAPANCHPEYRINVTNSGTSAINLTFTGVTSILTNNDEDVVINSNVITLSAGTTIECSIVNGKMVAIVF